MSEFQLKIDNYVKKQQKDKKIRDTDNYKFIFAYDETEHFVDIYKNNKLFIRAAYEVLGCYNIISSIWIWSWGLSEIERNLVKNTDIRAKKMYEKLSRGVITQDIEEYLYYLSNTTFFISYKNLDKLLKLGLYMTKNKYILPHKINDDKPKIIEFILIKNIIQEHGV